MLKEFKTTAMTQNQYTNNKLLKFFNTYFPIIIIEDTINNFCRTNNINIIKFTKPNLKIIRDIIPLIDSDGDFKKELELIDRIYADMPNINVTGKPDYFLWNKEDYIFAEYKTLRDNISEKQIKWFMDNIEKKICLIKSLKRSNEHSK